LGAKRKQKTVKKKAVARKVRSATGTLTRARIVKTAFAFIDRHGVDALTIRAIAKELGCAHTAVFWHYKSRDEMLRAVLSFAMEETSSEIPLEGAWDERAKTICRSLRRQLVKHPALFVLGSRYHTRGIGPSVRALTMVAEEAGYDRDQAVAAGRMLLELVGGYSMSQDSARAISEGRLPPDLIAGAQSVEDVHFIIAYCKVDHDLVFEAALEGVVDVLRRKTPLRSEPRK
jgi:TetR/AcrR family tetracycline transcriptional repressor